MPVPAAVLKRGKIFISNDRFSSFNDGERELVACKWKGGMWIGTRACAVDGKYGSMDDDQVVQVTYEQAVKFAKLVLDLAEDGWV